MRFPPVSLVYCKDQSCRSYPVKAKQAGFLTGENYADFPLHFLSFHQPAALIKF